MELAIETALHACSAALIEQGRVVAERHEVIARGHAERLMPLVAELLAGAGVSRADRIAVDIGPGSFTGIRVGLAAARAFALAWGVPAGGFTSAAVVAAGVFADHPAIDRLYVAFDASRGEVYAQAFDRDRAAGPLEALAPDVAARAAHGRTLAGSGAGMLNALDPGLALVDHPWPRAADARHLGEGAYGAAARPLYIRPPDAKVPA